MDSGIKLNDSIVPVANCDVTIKSVKKPINANVPGYDVVIKEKYVTSFINEILKYCFCKLEILVLNQLRIIYKP